MKKEKKKKRKPYNIIGEISLNFIHKPQIIKIKMRFIFFLLVVV